MWLFVRNSLTTCLTVKFFFTTITYNSVFDTYSYYYLPAE